MRVVVSGAGIAGLALAAGLRGAGIDTVVLEQHDGPDRTGAGLTLWPNALAAL